MVENYINEYAKESCCILRLSKVICTRTPIIKIWKKQILQGCAITAFTNKLLSPIYIDKVYQTVLCLISQDLCGTYQLGGETELSYFDFAKEYFGTDVTVLPSVLNEPVRHASLETYLPISFQPNPFAK